MNGIERRFKEQESVSDGILEKTQALNLESINEQELDKPLVKGISFIDGLKHEEMFRKGEFYDQGLNDFGYLGTCGETTQANTLNRLLGTNEFTEDMILKIAVEKELCCVIPFDPFICGGTTTKQFMKLYEEMNYRIGDRINTELYEGRNILTIEKMADRLEQGSVLNVAVDSCELWGHKRDVTEACHTDHWISVIGVDRNKNGDIKGFQIIDSGGGKKYLSRDQFERCCYGTGEVPMEDATCVVVSRKEDNI